MKIAELMQQYDQISTNRKYASLSKKAFVPNPNVPPPQPGQPVQQALPPGQMDPAQQQAAQQQMPPAQQAAPPQQQAPAPMDPSQQQMPAGQPGQNPMMDQLIGMVQQLPPQMQQELMPVIQQLQAMPPEQQQQQIPMIIQALQMQLQQMQGGGMQPQDPSQGAPMEAQAADEDLYAAAQGALPDTAAMPPQQEEDAAEQAAASADSSKNELDNVRVSLTVRELLDLVGKGTATATYLKVKQLADTHKQKMEQIKQKSDQQQADAQQQQQTAQQGMMSGGIYPAAMDANQ